MTQEYEVKLGDCVESVAAHFGLTAEALLAAQSQELKDRRGEGTELEVGEKLTIPELTLKEFQLETGKVHEITVYVPTVAVGFVLRRRDELALPYVECRYEAYLPGLPTPLAKGVTESDGYLELVAPADADVLEIHVWDNLPGIDPDEKKGPDGEGGGDGSTVIPVMLGHLPPIETGHGVQARLINLGIFCPLDGDLTTPEAKHALEDFQERLDLEITGEADDATKAALLRLNDGVEEEKDGERGDQPGTE
ncbi:MAG: peptidoglycan-binding domain-containing protein [Planctomycetota bacterium]